MINVNEYLTELTRNTEYVTIKKQNYNERITIHFSYPLSKIGFDDVVLTRMKTILASNWSQTENELQQQMLEYLDASIIPNYIDVLQQLSPRINLPAIVVAMLCQRLNRLDPKVVGTNAAVYNVENEYIYEVTLMTQVPVITNTFNGFLRLDRTKGFSNIKKESSISTIMWKVPYTDDAYMQYGVRHVWDHWDYEHFHIVDTYEEHKHLILTGIKRTWIAMLKYKAQTSNYKGRINYGYANNLKYPPWVMSQRKHLARLQLGTVYVPPSDLREVENMSIEQVEAYVLSAQPKDMRNPTVLKIYITAEQVAMELTLGNKLEQDRIKVLPSFDPLIETTTVDEIVIDKLPTGLAFDPEEFVDETSIRVIERQTVRIPNKMLTMFGWSQFSDFVQSSFAIMPYDVLYKLNQLRAITQRSLTTANLLSQISDDGINVNHGSLGERAILLCGLSLPDVNGQRPVINLNHDIENRAFLNLNSDANVPDYFTGTALINEISSYLTMVGKTYSDLGIGILNSQIQLSTFQQIMSDSHVRVTYHKTSDGFGTLVSKLFGHLNVNEVQYYNFSEKEWLSHGEDILKIILAISEDNMYSFEFTNFSSSILKDCIIQFNSILTLLNKNLIVKMMSPILNDGKGVGVRMLIHQHDAYINMFADINEKTLRPYSLVSTYDENFDNGYTSTTWSQKLVPHAGISLAIETSIDDLPRLMGYATSLSTHVVCRGFNDQYPFVRVGCVVSRERIAILDRLKMFRRSEDVNEITLRLRTNPSTFNLVNGTTVFELVTQTDRQLLYAIRKSKQLLDRDLTDYGSGPMLNIYQTNKTYTMYDQIDYEDVDIPGVVAIQAVLPISTPLPYNGNSDVLIYNSLFFNQAFEDVDIVVAIKTMLSGVINAQNLYLNFPYMDKELATILAPLQIVMIKNDVYYIKLGSYPPVRCLNKSEMTEVLDYLTANLYDITMIQPTWLDYVETSMMNRRYAVNQDYYTSIQLHLALPFLVCSKTR